LREKTVLLFRKTRRAINKRLANFQALAIMSHFNGGSPCMVIFSNGSGTGVSSPLEKVSAKGSARLLIQSRCSGSGVFVCAGCFRMGQKQPALYKPLCFCYNFAVLKKAIGCRLLFWGAAAVKWVWRRNAMKTFELMMNDILER
jgi:hypothetical protein